MKRIVIFCDGTWNTPDKSENGKPCQTNVVKLAKALRLVSDDGTEQKLYYDIGIGAEGSRIKRMFDGATGSGISENILQAYRFIIQNYVPGDELFFFGFSRGAFTVRSIAGLIRNSGILQLKYIDKTEQAYNLYRSRYPSVHPRSEEAILFRKSFAIEDSTTIKFIGVWDTVGALGNPLRLRGKGLFARSSEFHDTGISSKIENAYHALAIDEKRTNFGATLWYQKPFVEGQKLEQMWFPGVHSDVGGGYANTALSDIPLQWMKEKAEGCKLSFDKLVLNPNLMGDRHESMNWFFGLKGKLFRPIAVPDPEKGETYESVHPSAIERYKRNKAYRPKNLVDYFKRNPELLAD
jgi:uncharacterized protein (DUF2235 family)